MLLPKLLLFTLTAVVTGVSLISMPATVAVIRPLTPKSVRPVLVVPKRALLVKVSRRDFDQSPKPKWGAELLAGVKRFESFRSTRYVCSGGVLTIGYGQTGKNLPTRVSKSDAEGALVRDLAKAQSAVKRIVRVPLTNHQLAALTSFTFNCGEGNLRKLVSGPGRLNSGSYESVSRLLPQYRRGGGRVLRGLVKRRAWELRMWLGEP